MRSPLSWRRTVVVLALALVPVVSGGSDEGDGVPASSTAPPHTRDVPDHEPDPAAAFAFQLPHEQSSPLANDVRVSGPGEALAEVLIDVNPTNPLNLVICGHALTIGWMNTYYTFDGGVTWKNVQVGTWQDGFPFEFRFDPALAFDADGNVYVAYGLAHGTLPNRFTDVMVCKSEDGGRTYTQCTSVGSARTVDNLLGNDKFMLATGRDPEVADRQNVYVAWTWNLPTNNNIDQQIAIAVSTDGGASFSVPRVINDNSIVGRDRALFADPAVGPNGEVYVAWHDFDFSARIVVDRSLDGGVTWGNDVTVSTQALGLRTPIPPQPDRGIPAGPVMDVDISNGPHRGRAYIAYNHPTGNGFDVLLRYSDDQATTWSEPVRVVDDPGTRSQFLPWLDVGRNNGIVSVVFYDGREDPLDHAVKVYSAISRTGGESFEPNQPLADVPSNMTADNRYRYLGNYLEYIGVATLDCAAYVVWTDNRNQWPVYQQGSISHYYFDRIPFETNPPDMSCPDSLEVECTGGRGLEYTDPRFTDFINSCLVGDDCAPECALAWDIPGINLGYIPVGEWEIYVTAHDNAGNSSTCSTKLKVLDSSPPNLDVTVTPDVLWPPDHRMVEVRTTVVSGQDACSEVFWSLYSVTSDEPDDSAGDGFSMPDIEGVSLYTRDTDFRLRAERNAGGDGRRYQFVYYAHDNTNEVFDTLYVDVPQDLGIRARPRIETASGASIPAATALGTPHPNPFNPVTTIPFDLDRPQHVRLVIANVAGARVRTLLDENRPAGTHRVQWNGEDDAARPVASGIYFIRMQAGTYSSVQKLVLLK